MQKETGPLFKERMPSGLPGEGADKAEGSDKGAIAGIVSLLLWRQLYFSS